MELRIVTQCDSWCLDRFVLVLIQVSSMKTSRFGSRRRCHSLQRRCLKGDVGAPLLNGEQRFEAEPLAPQKLPDGVMGSRHAARRQIVLQPVQH